MNRISHLIGLVLVLMVAWMMVAVPSIGQNAPANPNGGVLARLDRLEGIISGKKAEKIVLQGSITLVDKNGNPQIILDPDEGIVMHNGGVYLNVNKIIHPHQKKLNGKAFYVNGGVSVGGDLIVENKMTITPQEIRFLEGIAVPGLLVDKQGIGGFRIYFDAFGKDLWGCILQLDHKGGNQQFTRWLNGPAAGKMVGNPPRRGLIDAP